MKVYVVISMVRHFANSELDVITKCFDTKEKAEKQIRDWYAEDIGNAPEIFDEECHDDSYYIVYTDKDGEHEINTEIQIRDVE